MCTIQRISGDFTGLCCLWIRGKEVGRAGGQWQRGSKRRLKGGRQGGHLQAKEGVDWSWVLWLVGLALLLITSTITHLTLSTL